VKLYYRISDKSYEKTKLIGASKEVCLMNFCKAFITEVFEAFDDDLATGKKKPNLKILCDNCNRKTTKMVASSGLPFTQTSLGNAGSLRKFVELALEEPDDEIVYFCEDDYLHLGAAPDLLREGIKRADYVTLYDHPDKYTRYYNGGEISKVIKTPSSHWRYTASTCMTFGTKVGTLREDMDIWFDEDLTGGDHPHDHHIFTKLHKKGRRLAVPIPGAACHTDMQFSGMVNYMLMEPWAIELMIKELIDEIDSYEVTIFNKLGDGCKDWCVARESILQGRTGNELLLAYDAVRQMAKEKSLSLADFPAPVEVGPA
jgi:hypothetical protein